MPESLTPWERVRRQIVAAVALLLVVAAVVAGLILAGRWSLDRLADDDRTWIDVAQIDCPAPPGMAKTDFLEEVRYQSRMPARVPTVGDTARAALTDAFRKHPRVASVDALRSDRPGQLRVDLTFRP